MVPLAQRISQPSKLVVLALLLAVCLLGALPAYWSGHWPWQDAAQAAQLAKLRELSSKGLAVPGWQTLNLQQAEISGQKGWAVQALSASGSASASSPATLALDGPKAGQTATLLLLPQRSADKKPQVEWLNIDGNQRWTADQLSHRSLGTLALQARFFRGWTPQGTNAVLQWYTWPGGGDAQPSAWFFADLRARLSGHRQPWVAVCIVVPTDSLGLGDIETAWPEVARLGEAVQQILARQYFASAVH